MYRFHDVFYNEFMKSSKEHYDITFKSEYNKGVLTEKSGSLEQLQVDCIIMNNERHKHCQHFGTDPPSL